MLAVAGGAPCQNGSKVAPSSNGDNGGRWGPPLTNGILGPAFPLDAARRPGHSGKERPPPASFPPPSFLPRPGGLPCSTSPPARRPTAPATAAANSCASAACPPWA